MLRNITQKAQERPGKRVGLAGAWTGFELVQADAGYVG